MSLDKVVVTGGAGFIGSNLVEELAKQYNVLVIDNLLTGRLENLSNIENTSLIKGSIMDLDLLKKSFIDVKYVFHQAALPSVQRSINDPIVTNNINIEGTLKVLLAAHECCVKKVIFASSSSVYGDTPILPKREDMIPNPKSPYAITKLVGEHYCKVFSEIYGLNTVCLRYFNVYGPKQDPNSQYAAVIPRFITRVLDGKPPIIFGDGSQTRDFTFVKDVVKANILASECEAQGVFNIACGQRISLNNLASKILRITGKNVDIVHDSPRQGDVKDSLADISLAIEKLGYRQNFDLNLGLKETLRWFQKN